MLTVGLRFTSDVRRPRGRVTSEMPRFQPFNNERADHPTLSLQPAAGQALIYSLFFCLPG